MNKSNPPRMVEGKKKLYRVFGLDDHSEYYYLTGTPLEAMQAHLYYLNLRRYDKNAKVELFGGGRTLSIIHNGMTYSCVNKVKEA